VDGGRKVMEKDQVGREGAKSTPNIQQNQPQEV